MVATRFAVAIHILLMLASSRTGAKATSGMLARSVNTNPVVVRRITGMLSRAGLIRVHRGPGGAELARPAESISLGDVWLAVNPGQLRPLLPVHATADQSCRVGRLVPSLLGDAFTDAELAMHQSLSKTSLGSLLHRLECEAAA